MLKKWLKRVSAWFWLEQSERDRETESAYLPREKLLVFSLSLLLACCLWFIVNLNRDFSISVQFPLQIVHVSDDMALVDEPPSHVQVGMTGEGWSLISLYRKPPVLRVESDERDVNLYEVVQQQLSILSDVNVTQVRPNRVELELEERLEREVPVESLLNLQLRDRYQLLGPPVMEPDRAVIRGGKSVVDRVDTLRTEPMEVRDLHRSGQVRLNLTPPERGVRVEPETVVIHYEIAEFTEGEVTVPVRIQGVPSGQQIRYQPSSVSIRFDVPIEQYNDLLDANPFRARIHYSDLSADTTGQLLPEIDVEGNWTVRIRQVRPARIRYFRVLEP